MWEMLSEEYTIPENYMLRGESGYQLKRYTKTECLAELFEIHDFNKRILKLLVWDLKINLYQKKSNN